MSDAKDDELQQALQEKARLIQDPAGREVLVIGDADGLEIASRFNVDLQHIYVQALSLQICPHRYLRNRESISLEDQLRLTLSQVTVVGAGGLGGHVIHLLARIGVGCLVVVDSDCFDETNLNRQIFCTMESVGKPKAQVATERVKSINPGVLVQSHWSKMDKTNLPRFLAGSSVVVDGLDNIRDRLVLERGARDAGIPLVHGALAGFDGQVMTVFPEDRGLAPVYGEGERAEKDPASPEAVLGVPALMPSVIATFQCMEVIKILLGRKGILRNTMLHISLGTGELNQFRFE